MRPNIRRVADVVADGLISEVRAGSGRGEPIVIIDSTHLPEVKEAIRVAEHEPAGDVAVSWATTKRSVMLHIVLLRPLETEFWVHFSLPKHGVLIELALKARVIRLQTGKPGDSVKSTLLDGGLRVEIPGLEGIPDWPNPYLTAYMEKRRREGVRIIDARNEAGASYKVFADALNALPRFEG